MNISDAYLLWPPPAFSNGSNVCLGSRGREGESEDVYMAASQTPLRLMADATPLKRLQASAFCPTS